MKLTIIFLCFSHLLLLMFGIAFGRSPSAEEMTECVILLHGLGRSSRSMDKMARKIGAAGYHAVNIDYPSQDDTIENLAMQAIPEGLGRCREVKAGTIHFVTHSMGGILLRYYLSRNSIETFGRAVMLSPPNQGSEVADNLKDWATYQWYNGPAGQQLGTNEDSLVMQLGPVTFPLGIITGDVHAFFDTWMADMIPGPNDGKVSVENAKIDGMTDFMVLPHNHTFIMEKEDVIRQTLFFLKNEKFSRKESSNSSPALD